MIDQLIRKLTFNPLDPFDIKTDIFPSSAKQIPNYNQFLSKFYRHWFIYTFTGEFESTIVYPGIADRIKNYKYNEYLCDLSHNEINTLCGYFAKIAKDEADHTKHFLNFIKTIYGDSVEDITSAETLDLARQQAEHKVESVDFIELLISYYIVECYLWTGFYQIYKKTTDSDRRIIFKKILVEEAQHNNNHYKLLKKIKNKITTDPLYFVNKCKDLRYFSLDFVKIQFGLADTNTRKDHFLLELTYNSQWHREFNQILIKKWYQLFEILYPNTSLDQFTAIINCNDGEWSKLPIKSGT